MSSAVSVPSPYQTMQCTMHCTEPPRCPHTAASQPAGHHIPDLFPASCPLLTDDKNDVTYLNFFERVGIIKNLSLSLSGWVQHCWVNTLRISAVSAMLMIIWNVFQINHQEDAPECHPAAQDTFQSIVASLLPNLYTSNNRQTVLTPQDQIFQSSTYKWQWV